MGIEYKMAAPNYTDDLLRQYRCETNGCPFAVYSHTTTDPHYCPVCQKRRGSHLRGSRFFE
jgi:hypothetical protein